MPSAASHHYSSARLEGVRTESSRILPLVRVHQPLVALARSGRGRDRPEEARRNKMNTTSAIAVRAYSTLKSSLALVGIAALAAFLALAGPREALLNHLPSLSVSALAEPL